MGIGENIKNKRLQKGMTLEELAKKIGTSKQTIQRYEAGVIVNIPSDKIEQLAAVLETTPSALLGWDKKRLPTVVMASGGEGQYIHQELNREKIAELVREAENLDEQTLNILIAVARTLKEQQK